MIRNPVTVRLTPVGGSTVAEVDASGLEGFKFRVERGDNPAEYFSELINAVA